MPARSPVVTLVIAFTLLACSSTPGDTRAPGASPEGGSQDVSAPGDAGAEPSPAYPAFHPSMPQIQQGSGAVNASPVVVPVYFGGETLQAALDATVSTWLASPAFRTSLQEYGVSSATVAPSIALTEAAPANAKDTDIEAWLKGKLDGTHPEFGPVDATTLAARIFVLYYPEATTITRGGPTPAQSCGGWDGYHAGAALASGAVAHYVVLARCTPSAGAVLDLLTSVATSMIASDAADPLTSLSGQPAAWGGFDAPHAMAQYGNDEVGSACELLPPAAEQGVSGAVDRIWSNAAAAAYHDPCLPAPSDPYFVAVPVLTDDIDLGSAHTKGVIVPRGQSVTVEVQLLSDGPTDAWDLSAPISGGLDLTFDQPTGNDGDTRKLTVHAPSSAPPGVLVGIACGRDQHVRSYWTFPVQTK